MKYMLRTEVCFKEDRYRKFLLSIAALLLLQSCMGTAGTRFQDGSFAGAYPYSAVGTDIVLAKYISGNDSIHGFGYGAMGIISVPLDILIDTALLPFDLMAWPFGFKKSFSAR